MGSASAGSRKDASLSKKGCAVNGQMTKAATNEYVAPPTRPPPAFSAILTPSPPQAPRYPFCPQQGFELVPLVITVGDYVLTPEICVERKSLSDLFQSMTSGRLFNQVCMHSRGQPCLFPRPWLLFRRRRGIVNYVVAIWCGHASP